MLLLLERPVEHHTHRINTIVVWYITALSDIYIICELCVCVCVSKRKSLSVHMYACHQQFQTC